MSRWMRSEGSVETMTHTPPQSPTHLHPSLPRHPGQATHDSDPHTSPKAAEMPRCHWDELQNDNIRGQLGLRTNTHLLPYSTVGPHTHTYTRQYAKS